MLLLLATWLTSFVALVGLGLLAVRLARSFRVVAVVPRIWPIFWLGLCAALALLSLLSLLRPIAGLAALLLTVAGVIGWTLEGRLALHDARRALGRPAAGLYAAAVVLVPPLIAYSASRPVTWFDSVSTHLGQVRWISDYGAVPGLANLYPTLGFDSSFHCFAALFNHGPLRDRAGHVAVAFVFTMTLLNWAAVALLDSSLRARLFCILSAPFLLPRIWGIEVPSLSCDLPMACLALLVALEWVRVADQAGRTRPLLFGLFLSVTFAAAALATKLSGLALFGTVALLAVVALRRRGVGARAWSGILSLPALLLVGMAARRAILTGWLGYPIQIGRLGFAWTVPRSELWAVTRWIRSWARIPGVRPEEVLDHGFLHWFRPWFVSFRHFVELYVFILTVIGLLVHLAWPQLRRWTRWELAAPAVASVALIYWFVGAPDPRFGAIHFWILFATSFATILAHAATRRTAAELRRMLTRTIALASLALGLFVATLAWGIHRGVYQISPFPRLRWLTIDPDPAQPTEIITYGAGEDRLQVNHVVGKYGCGNAPLPCSPGRVPIRLRTPPRLGGGFVLRRDEPLGSAPDR